MSCVLSLFVTRRMFIGVGIAASLLCLTGIAHAQTLYAINQGADGTAFVSRITEGGNVTNISLQGAPSSFAQGLAVDAAGNLYVSFTDFSSIGKFDSAGNALPFTLSGGIVDGPTDLVFDAQGNLYTANQNTDTISKITPGGVVSTFATGNHLEVPWQLAFGPDGVLYASSFGDSEFVSKFDSAGNPLPALVLSGALNHFNGPGGLVFDALGNLYATGFDNTLDKVDTTTGIATMLGAGIGGVDADILVSPVRDSAGNFYAAGLSNTISKFDAAGNLLPFPLSGDMLSSPFDLVFVPSVRTSVPESGTLALFGIGLPVAGAVWFLTGRSRRYSSSIARN